MIDGPERRQWWRSAKQHQHVISISTKATHRQHHDQQPKLFYQPSLSQCHSVSTSLGITARPTVSASHRRHSHLRSARLRCATLFNNLASTCSADRGLDVVDLVPELAAIILVQRYPALITCSTLDALQFQHRLHDLQSLESGSSWTSAAG